MRGLRQIESNLLLSPVCVAAERRHVFETTTADSLDRFIFIACNQSGGLPIMLYQSK